MLHHFYGGRRRPGLTHATTPVLDPATGQLYDEAPVAGPEDLDAAFAAARGAFPSWRDTPPGARAGMLFRLVIPAAPPRCGWPTVGPPLTARR